VVGEEFQPEAEEDSDKEVFINTKVTSKLREATSEAPIEIDPITKAKW